MRTVGPQSKSTHPLSTARPTQDSGIDCDAILVQSSPQPPRACKALPEVVTVVALMAKPPFFVAIAQQPDLAAALAMPYLGHVFSGSAAHRCCRVERCVFQDDVRPHAGACALQRVAIGVVAELRQRVRGDVVADLLQCWVAWRRREHPLEYLLAVRSRSIRDDEKGRG